MILGYDSEKKAYTFNAFDSMGQNETATGTVEGDTWTWRSDSMMGGKPVKSRFTVKELSPTAYTTKFEMAGAGWGWENVMGREDHQDQIAFPFKESARRESCGFSPQLSASSVHCTAALFQTRKEAVFTWPYH